jgi:hypothetical protein
MAIVPTSILPINGAIGTKRPTRNIKHAHDVLHNENIHGLSLKTQVQTKDGAAAEETRFSERMLYETWVRSVGYTTCQLSIFTSGIGRMKSTQAPVI